MPSLQLCPLWGDSVPTHPCTWDTEGRDHPMPSPVETYLDWAITQEVQIHVLSKEVTFRVGGVKFLTSHEKVRSKVVSWFKKTTTMAD